jgi:hypothetical protein
LDSSIFLTLSKYSEGSIDTTLLDQIPSWSQSETSVTPIKNKLICVLNYSRIPLIRMNWDDETLEYTENPDNLIFFKNRLLLQSEVEKNFHKQPFWATFIYVQIKH